MGSPAMRLRLTDYQKHKTRDLQRIGMRVLHHFHSVMRTSEPFKSRSGLTRLKE